MYVNELLYRGMTNQDIAKELQKINIDRRDEVFADIQNQINRRNIPMGWNIKPTLKGSINIGIDMIRRYKYI